MGTFHYYVQYYSILQLVIYVTCGHNDQYVLQKRNQVCSLAAYKRQGCLIHTHLQ